MLAWVELGCNVRMQGMLFWGCSFDRDLFDGVLQYWNEEQTFGWFVEGLVWCWNGS